MEIVNTIAALRERLAAHRRAGKSIGLVPTMGYLHAGHMELVSRARAENDIVVISIFVNPTQFGPNEDFAAYPRSEAEDVAKLEEIGAHLVWAPTLEEMYPPRFSTYIRVEELTEYLDGPHRPGHFQGVATVVAKLLRQVAPDRAYFGEKDYQQVAVIRRMVEDLAQPVRVVPVPTVRDADGLALSSRNVYLSQEERAAAIIVPKALAEAARLYDLGIDDPTAFEEALRAFIEKEPLATAEVAAVRHPDTLAHLTKLQGEPVLVALFVRIGTTRLLDNRVIGRKQSASEKAA